MKTHEPIAILALSILLLAGAPQVLASPAHNGRAGESAQLAPIEHGIELETRDKVQPSDKTEKTRQRPDTSRPFSDGRLGESDAMTKTLPYMMIRNGPIMSERGAMNFLPSSRDSVTIGHASDW